MTDQHSLDLLNQLHPKVRQSAIDAYNEAVQATPKGVHPSITQTYRSFEESDKIYQQGRTTPGGIVSNAKAGQSWHNWSLALDFVLLANGNQSWKVDNNWMVVVSVFKKHGWAWGGDWKSFKDFPHLEKQCGQTLKGLMELKKNGKFIPGTNFIDF